MSKVTSIFSVFVLMLLAVSIISAIAIDTDADGTSVEYEKVDGYTYLFKSSNKTTIWTFEDDTVQIGNSVTYTFDGCGQHPVKYKINGTTNTLIVPIYTQKNIQGSYTPTAYTGHLFTFAVENMSGFSTDTVGRTFLTYNTELKRVQGTPTLETQVLFQIEQNNVITQTTYLSIQNGSNIPNEPTPSATKTFKTTIDGMTVNMSANRTDVLANSWSVYDAMTSTKVYTSMANSTSFTASTQGEYIICLEVMDNNGTRTSCYEIVELKENETTTDDNDTESKDWFSKLSDWIPDDVKTFYENNQLIVLIALFLVAILLIWRFII